MKERRIFLIDSGGALLSAFVLMVILVRFNEHFGISEQLLYFLGSIACVYAVFSFSCFLLVKENFRLFLRITGFANLSYCILTIIMLSLFHQNITLLGILYFIAEIITIGVLVWIELKAASGMKS